MGKGEENLRDIFRLQARYCAKATPDKPIARISMENDGGLDGARLQLTLWPEGHVYELGRADFHGRWVDWQNPIIKSVT